MYKKLIIILTFAIFCCGLNAQNNLDYSESSYFKPNSMWQSAFGQTKVVKPGLERMSKIELLPVLYPSGTRVKQIQSMDVTGGNMDGDFIHAFVKYVDKNGEYVIFDEYGPGCLYRQQMNIWNTWNNKVIYVPGAGEARIKYYFDDDPIPKIDMKMDDLFSVNNAHFGSPFSFKDTIKKDGFAELYYPFVFKKRLKITVVPTFDWTTRWCTWYQYTYLLFPQETSVNSYSNLVIDKRKKEVVKK